MARVRGTIEMLTKILRENGTSKIKAETFRQAKFNQDEAVPGLWRLLFELIYFCQYNQIDEVAIRAFADLSPDELVTYVKHELQDRGFRSYDFALLPTDFGHGSRELLLAIGWLMCKEHTIDRFIMKCTAPLDDGIPNGSTTERHSFAEAEILSSFIQDGSQLITREGDKLSWLSSFQGDPHERLEQLLWLNNKMRVNLRSLLALQRQKNALAHKIHKYTEGVSLSPERNHLSEIEVLMLRHPELLKKNLQLLEKDNERLQNLLDWRDHEDIFWKWMESVLDAKLSEAAGDIVSLSSVSSLVPGSAAEQLMRSHLNLREAIVKYESIIDHLERVWSSKNDDVSEEDIDSVLASIDLELSIQKANIALNNTQDYVQRHQQENQWNYVKNAKPSVPAVTAASLGGGDGWHNVETEIDGLKGIVEQLQAEVDMRKGSYREELQALSEKFDDAICIPPMSVSV